MATTNAELHVFDSWKREIQEKNVDISTDTFICGLSTVTWVPLVSTHEVLGDVTNEVVGNGYSRQTLTGVALTEPSLGTWQFDANNPVFTAAGGSIVARYYWIFDDTSISPADILFCFGLLDDTPLDVTTTDTNTLTLQVHVQGFYRMAGGQ